MSLKPIINCRPLSDALDSRSIRIRRDRESVTQTLSRLERMLKKLSVAASRGNQQAEKALAQLNDETYSLYSELAADEADWE